MQQPLTSPGMILQVVDSFLSRFHPTLFTPIDPPQKDNPPVKLQPTNQQFFCTTIGTPLVHTLNQPVSTKKNAAQPASWTNAPVSKRRMSCVEDRLDPFRTTMPPLSPPPSTRQMADMALAEYWRAKMWQH